MLRQTTKSPSRRTRLYGSSRTTTQSQSPPWSLPPPSASSHSPRLALCPTPRSTAFREQHTDSNCDPACSWHKVKIKVADPAAEAAPVGLVPASYLAPSPAVRSTVALYDYIPTVDDQTGELENDEEMPITEGEELEVLDEEEPDWVLCRKANGQKGVGYVPATYIEVRTYSGST